jgi:signal transduction histidine kinase/ActR/RegA family two-component response regulator
MRFRTSAMLDRAAARLPIELSPVDAERVADAQLREVWLHSRHGVWMSGVFAVVMAVYWLDAFPAALVRGWLALKLISSAVRIVQARAYFLDPAAGGPRWRHATLALLAVDGAIWGLAGFWTITYASFATASFSIALLAAISCVATFGLQVSVRATAAYALPILVPTACGMLLRVDEIGWVGGIGLMLLATLQLAAAVRSQRGWCEGQLLRLQAQQLVRDKDDALALALRQSGVKSQFFANVSHELRTPLHGILGLARLLQTEVDDMGQRRRLELIDASGTHLLGLINDLLDVSRIEAGQFAIRPQAFELGAQIDQVAEVCALRAHEQGLRFVQQLEFERPCWVSGDAGRVRQVLLNLIGNALKFTEAGSVTLTVRRSAAVPDLVSAEITDTGVGIAPHELPRLFDAFAQMAPALHSPLDGTGLGLTISREIARAMGGEVTVRSRLGEGSTFVFTAQLPACEPVAAQTAPAARVDDWRPPAGRVLVADDDDVNALIVTAYLERLGLVVERARDGGEAVVCALRAADRPALVLMDCQMPQMDGHVAARQIRAQEAALGLARVPVIAMTASFTEIDLQRFRADGMDDLLGKPFDAADLSAVLERVLVVRPPLPRQAAA